jgi:hypothetical protein
VRLDAFHLAEVLGFGQFAVVHQFDQVVGPVELLLYLLTVPQERVFPDDLF